MTLSLAPRHKVYELQAPLTGAAMILTANRMT